MVELRVEDRSALAAGQRHDEDLDALVDIAGGRRRALARLVVGMRVNRHQPQRLTSCARHLGFHLALTALA